jgi:hypothetical protein
MKKAQRWFFLGLCIVAAVLVFTTGCAHQDANKKVKVTGAELERRGAERAVTAGYNPGTGCAWMIVYFAEGSKVRQTYDCWGLTGTSWGTYRVDGDKICTSWDNPQIPAGCTEVYKIDEVKYEAWINGTPAVTFYRVK